MCQHATALSLATKVDLLFIETRDLWEGRVAAAYRTHVQDAQLNWDLGILEPGATSWAFCCRPSTGP